MKILNSAAGMNQGLQIEILACGGCIKHQRLSEADCLAATEQTQHLSKIESDSNNFFFILWLLLIGVTTAYHLDRSDDSHMRFGIGFFTLDAFPDATLHILSGLGTSN